MEREYLDEINRKVDDCARGAAIATQTTWDKVPTAAPYNNLRNNPAGVEALGEVYEELGVPVNGDHSVIFGSSDIGNVSFVCPTFHPTLQLVERGIAIHTREFAAAVKTDRAHECIETGAKIIGLQVAKIFSDEKRIAAMKADFNK